MSRHIPLREFLFALSVASLLSVSCHQSVRNSNSPEPTPTPSSPCTATTSLQYSACSASEGCTLEFTCPLTASASKSSFQKFGHYISQIFTASTPVTLEISTLTINEAALLAGADTVAEANWYNSSVSCTKDGTTVTCPHFLPIASNFTIAGTLGEETATIDVTVSGASPGAIQECGRSGTTVQRMFDCSQRVTVFAGSTQDNGTLIPFVPGTPDPNWFLVSCPTGSDIEKCFWLSPVMASGNPSLGNGSTQFDSFHESMNGSPYLNGRLLWSGLSDSTYLFYNANDNGVALSNYDNYPFVNYSIMAVFDGTPHTLSGSICQTGSDPALLSGDAYNWQMPSYPMIMTLTGGTGSNGEYCVNNPGDLLYCNPQGFRATATAIPSFLTNFWSSSVNVFNSNAWFFGADGALTDSSPAELKEVRCASAAW